MGCCKEITPKAIKRRIKRIEKKRLKKLQALQRLQNK